MTKRQVAIAGASEWYIAQQHWPNDVMYHYTSREAVESIVTTRRMWATDLRAMNDPHEVRYGKAMIDQRIKSAIRRLQNELKEKFLRAVQSQFQSLVLGASSSFAISFSEHPDLGHQWRDYARDGTGFALGWSIDDPCPEIPLRMWVTYDRARQKQLVDGLIAFHLDWIRNVVTEHGLSPADAFADAGLSLAMFLNAVLHTFKGKRWAPESEFRYMYQVFHGYERPGQQVLDREVNGIRKRYIEADFSQVELRRVIMGPRNDAASTAAWLRTLLDSTGFPETMVVQPLISVEDMAP